MLLKLSYLQLLMILLKDKRGGWASGKSLAGQRVIGLKFYEKDLWCLWQGIEPRPGCGALLVARAGHGELHRDTA